VDRDAFFARFEEVDAVRYFYEPFLAAFDPELRKQLGVWYTPREIVRYMVERVDQVLRSELGLADGLADPSVWIRTLAAELAPIWWKCWTASPEPYT
jgi:type I restriction-modification system DNA methylase subunit